METARTDPHPADARGTFAGGRLAWLDGVDRVRNRVRQEMISRQLSRHLPSRSIAILDVGAGQGTQSIRLARDGHLVLAIEPDREMRSQFASALAEEDRDVRGRVRIADGALGRLAEITGGHTYAAVLALGVLMYLPASAPAVAELAAQVAPGGVLAIAVRTTTSALWRPAARQDWLAARAAFDEVDAARAAGRDIRYLNELGTPARADDVDALTAVADDAGLVLEDWYGVRIAVDQAEDDPAPPSDPAEWAALLEVEERLGATDPYRQLAQLAHLVFRRPISEAERDA